MTRGEVPNDLRCTIPSRQMAAADEAAGVGLDAVGEEHEVRAAVMRTMLMSRAHPNGKTMSTLAAHRSLTAITTTPHLNHQVSPIAVDRSRARKAVSPVRLAHTVSDS